MKKSRLIDGWDTLFCVLLAALVVVVTHVLFPKGDQLIPTVLIAALAAVAWGLLRPGKSGKSREDHNNGS